MRELSDAMLSAGDSTIYRTSAPEVIFEAMIDAAITEKPE